MSTNTSVDLEQQIERTKAHLDQLRNDLAERKSRIDDLYRRRKALTKELGAIDEELNQLSGSVSLEPSRTRSARGRKAQKPSNGRTRSRSSRARKRKGAEGKPSLRQVLTDILTNSSKPLMPRELAEKAQEAGYPTSSNNFSNVVQVTLTKMNVQRIPGEGYVLK
jgi:chromosome segregation ATPase